QRKAGASKRRSRRHACSGDGTRGETTTATRRDRPACRGEKCGGGGADSCHVGQGTLPRTREIGSRVEPTRRASGRRLCQGERRTRTQRCRTARREAAARSAERAADRRARTCEHRTRIGKGRG